MDTPKLPIQRPVITFDPDCFGLPGVELAVNPADAAKMGVFEETALSEQDAWDAALQDDESRGGDL